MIGEIYLPFELVVMWLEALVHLYTAALPSSNFFYYMLLRVVGSVYFTCHLNVLVAHCCFRARGENVDVIFGVKR